MKKSKADTENIKELGTLPPPQPPPPPFKRDADNGRVPFDIGVEFCRKYGVEEILRPLLEFDSSSSGDLHQTPTKEEANAAKRKQMYSNPNGRQYSQDTGLLGYNRFGPPLLVPSPTPSQPSQHSGYRADQYVPSHWGSQQSQHEPPVKRHRYTDQDSNPSFKVESQEM